MGGKISVVSEAGKGSCFSFHLPLVAIDVPANKQPEPSTLSPAEKDIPVEKSNAKILLVEDNKVNQMVALGMLKTLGYRCSIANHGAEALTAVEAEVFDLILMDMQMPVMDGVTATKRIRNLDHPSALTPIVAVTANVMPDDLKACLDAGMNDYLCKPFNKAELSERIEKYLGSA